MDSKNKFRTSRRNFVKGAGSALVASAAGLTLADVFAAQGNEKYNILMILTDQERHMSAAQMPAGYRLPAHDKLASRGVGYAARQPVLARKIRPGSWL
jgi:hypothetical protein